MRTLPLVLRGMPPRMTKSQEKPEIGNCPGRSCEMTRGWPPNNSNAYPVFLVSDNHQLHVGGVESIRHRPSTLTTGSPLVHAVASRSSVGHAWQRSADKLSLNGRRRWSAVASQQPLTVALAIPHQGPAAGCGADVFHSFSAGSNRLFVTSATGDGTDGALTTSPCRTNTPC